MSSLLDRTAQKAASFQHSSGMLPPFEAQSTAAVLFLLLKHSLETLCMLSECLNGKTRVL